jgi:hypothetical protein
MEVGEEILKWQVAVVFSLVVLQAFVRHQVRRRSALINRCVAVNEYLLSLGLETMRTRTGFSSDNDLCQGLGDRARMLGE